MISVINLKQILGRIVPLLQLRQVDVLHRPLLGDGVHVTLGHEQLLGVGVMVQTPRIATVDQPLLLRVVPPELIAALAVAIVQRHRSTCLVTVHIQTNLPTGFNSHVLK